MNSLVLSHFRWCRFLSLVTKSKKEINSRFIIHRTKFPTEQVRFVTYRKPKETPGKSKSNEKPLIYDSKSFKRDKLKSVLKPSLPVNPEPVKTRVVANPFGKPLVAATSLESKMEYLKLLASTVTRDGDKRTNPIPDKLIICISEIMNLTDLSCLDICLNNITNTVKKLNLVKNHSLKYRIVLSTIILPNFIKLSQTPLVTTKDMIRILQWMKSLDTYIFLIHDSSMRRNALKILEKSLNCHRDSNELSCVEFADILYCAWKLGLNASLWSKEVTSAFLAASTCSLSDPRKDILNASSIPCFMHKLGMVLSDPNYHEPILQWSSIVFEDALSNRAVVLNGVNHDKGVAQAVSNVIVGLASMNFSAILNAGIHPSAQSSSIIAIALRASILVIPNLSEQSLSGMIYSFGVMRLEWRGLPAELQYAIRSAFGNNFHLMGHSLAHNALHGFWKMHASFKDLVQSEEQRSKFWKHLIHLLRSPSEKNSNEDIVFAANLATSLSSLQISFQSDVPDECHTELINSFIRHSPKFSVQHYSLSIRGFGLMKLPFEDMIANEPFRLAIEQPLLRLLPSFSVQSLSMVYLGLSKMNADWKMLSATMKQLLTLSYPKSVPTSFTSLDGHSIAIVMYSLVSMNASWNSLPNSFRQCLWQSLCSPQPFQSSSTLAMLIWSLGEMGWQSQSLQAFQKNELSPSSRLQEELRRFLPTMKNLPDIVRVLNGLVEMDFYLSGSKSKDLWPLLWNALDRQLLHPQDGSHSLGTIMRSLPCMLFDAPTDALVRDEKILTSLIDKLLKHAIVVEKSSSASSLSQWSFQRDIFLRFLQFGLPRDSSIAGLLKKYPQFNLPLLVLDETTNSWVVPRTSPVDSLMSQYHKVVADKLAKRLPTEFQMVHEFSGLGNIFPIDIAIVHQSGGKKSPKKLVGFIEVNGYFHYRPRLVVPEAVSSASPNSVEQRHFTTDENISLSLRRIDLLKERLYFCKFPQISFFLRVPPSDSQESLDDCIERICEQICASTSK